MITSLAIFAAVSMLTPWLAKRLGRRVFAVIALVPAAVFVVLLTWLPGVLAGTPVVESVSWIPELDIALSFRMDALALILSLVVTGIGALVLLYCTWYFADDEPALGRFAGLLLAFAGVMLGLVTSDDVFVLFTFWEATSVLSYLLIGHYTGRKESRGAALQALTVTTFGGLAMLVGLVLLAVEGGTTSLSELIANPVTGAAAEWGIALVLVGAISKSALVPFHFWLPAAMAAPTPVSAYLHAAAMVKAGVYLVARLAPGYADLSVWHPIVIGLGVLTMLVGGWRALRQYDLKLLLAYGTVSQLGFLVLVTGFGTRDAALAGVALLLAHAMFKAALFLTVGIVDHAAGTRDWRRLSGLGRRMPVVATIAALAAASMAGIPPLLGFVAKEGVFTAFLDATEAGGQVALWAWIALVGAVAGSVLTFAYTARFLWGAFSTKPDVAPTPLHATGAAIAVAPGVLAAASLVAAFAIGFVEPLLTAYADDLPGEHAYHLALWHGLEPALFISLGVFAVGGLMVWARREVARLQAAVVPMVDSSRGYLGIVSAVDRTAAAITTAIQSRGLPGYLTIIVAVFIGGLGTASILNSEWPADIRLWDFSSQPFIAAVMCVAAVAAVLVRQRMTAVLLVSVTGYGLVLLFGMSGAPDLALTQALVETIVLVVFVLVLRRLPKQIAQRNPPVHKVARGVIGAVSGVVMGVIGLVALGARIEPTIAGGLPALSLEAHGKNIVNVMLVDIRAWDTLGEISVLVAVATGVASLIFVSGRTGGAPRLDDGDLGLDRRDRIRPLPEQAASIRAPRTSLANTDGETDAAAEAASTRQTWLLAGRTISPRNRSILIEVLVRLLFHPAIVVSVFLLFVGHNAPGGGFAGGLLAGLALVARYLAGGRYELGEAAPVDAGRLLGTGLLLAAGTATASLFFSGIPLESAWFEAEVPVLGTISIGTSTLFDIGVYLVVVGLVLDILRSLGGEVDRQQEEASEDETPESAPTEGVRA
ncbi:multisubunit sodium/proton antiporter, MrpA subunit /multisubunit sodium/proton antiporter, MrpB subunit [Agromyces sp. CF514]|uniref:Na+/H+ antiporter subunit A n=1 Tax=Agromyces sp. CF514 TaxID=1881031 RepID=UPI0008E257F6|nr:Na+/H+ antiporter subunit A [Agromyces sp. CF514]SFR82976.1 multisubunit sodium/proton antiporter, MrpA subunit /multisubunit sodium/proton antiporter, MrpB subunit [Agromyces sp. CF514]